MILAYHRINPWYEEEPLTVNPKNFERQICYLLKRNLKNTSLENYGDISKKFVVTFDDGFYDNFLFGLPLFKKLNLKPVIFIIAKFINTEKIWERYKNRERDRFLTWQEINEMIKENVEIGSHTLTHPHLINISEALAKEEIMDSKKFIEDKIGKEVKYFCYPYGEFNEKLIEIVKLSGYKCAVVTPKRDQKLKWTKFTMKRIGIYGHNNFFVYKLKIWKELLREKI
ncbi:MAG: polysaccharide deacetylase family protein [bacterium]|nr:polysaccharide deacetylase family protein [bacterium]MDW8163787.1 polysaccharide deacetylase family protein [Candidatus Omnitrophota bacterium]